MKHSSGFKSSRIRSVYDADLLFHAFLTLTKQKQIIMGGKVSIKFCIFSFLNNLLELATIMSIRVKKIRSNLDAIAYNHAPMWRRREKTCSCVHEGNITGREDDVEMIECHFLTMWESEVCRKLLLPN